ncbi:hypothetical protein JCM33374_g6381 [Metschnikowia sp. JCM 33374]|nr:hypothetical protein JCM33374_g6381 [Metschnikowia sp. JCM 33374]
MKIPPIIRSVFEIFPLKSYNPEFEEHSAPEDIYNFVSRDNLEQTREEFTLAVHNVRGISLSGVTKFVPTDPTGLTAALVLCLRNDLLLPNERLGNKTRHGLIPLSHLASPTRELPILLETDNGKNSCITISPMLNINKSSNKSFLESILNEFLDSLNDLWTLVLLADALNADCSVLKSLFHRDPELKDDNIISRSIDYKLSGEMQSWNKFAARHPNILSSPSSTFNSVKNWAFLPSEDHKALEQMYQSKLAEFEKFVPLFLSHLSSVGNSISKDIIELKFVSFMICVEYFLPPDTQLSLTCKKNFNGALEYSKRVLMKF